MPIGNELDITDNKERLYKLICTVFGAFFAIYHVLALQFLIIDPLALRTAFLAGTVVLTFLYWPSPIKHRLTATLVDVLLAIGCMGAAIYVGLNYKEMIYRVGISPTLWDTIFGAIVILVTLEVARRTLGLGLPILATLLLIYAQFGHLLPGKLGHGGFSIERIISIIFSSSGIFGIPLSVSITYVLPFVIFGAFLEVNGTGAYIMELSKALTGRFKGGAAKIATLSSSLFGSINGSPVANVVSTGVITIPMMKKGGYSPVFAGSVEAVASTGGQILPPIMGASAFIMMEILGVPYSTIALAALIPALLYYIAVFWAVDLEAGRTGLKPLPKEEIPSLRKLLREKGHLLIPLVILVVALIGFGLSPMRSAIYGIISAIIIPAFKKETRLSVSHIIKSFELGAKNTVTVATATAAAGIIVGVLGMTGIGHQFASGILALAGGNLLPALILTAIIALILGVGMPTTGAYIVTASVLPTALMPLGVDPLAIHLFLLYFANISNITPPVALASFAAAGLAGASPMKVGIASFRLGIIGFIIPFMFIYSPAILLIGTVAEIIIASITATIGVMAFAIGILGWYRYNLIWWKRILLAIGAISLIYQGLLSDLFGLILISLVMVFIYYKSRTSAQSSASISKNI